MHLKLPGQQALNVVPSGRLTPSTLAFVRFITVVGVRALLSSLSFFCFLAKPLLLFCLTGDGEVDISEFLTQWGQLKEEPNNTIDVSVDITG